MPPFEFAVLTSRSPNFGAGASGAAAICPRKIRSNISVFEWRGAPTSVKADGGWPWSARSRR
jgi:hypothetical protein